VLPQLERVQRQQVQRQLAQRPQVLQRLAQVLGQQVQQLALLRSYQLIQDVLQLEQLYQRQHQ
jgi:hypothetical protein